LPESDKGVAIPLEDLRFVQKTLRHRQIRQPEDRGGLRAWTPLILRCRQPVTRWVPPRLRSVRTRSREKVLAAAEHAVVVVVRRRAAPQLQTMGEQSCTRRTRSTRSTKTRTAQRVDREALPSRRQELGQDQ
jgi:hypothetical protein